jgi:hypothetical protein
LRDLDEGMIDVPDSIAEDPFLDFFCFTSKLLEVVNILLKVLIKQFLCMDGCLPLGSLSSAAFRSASCYGSSSDES